MMLYGYAAETYALVLGTTNRSEAEVGYYTKWGDGAVDIEPLAEYYKTEVFQMAREVCARHEITTEIVEKPPSAGLWIGQKDEDELPPYDLLDQYLVGRGGETKVFVANCSFNVEGVESIIAATKHKREMPPSCARLTPTDIL